MKSLRSVIGNKSIFRLETHEDNLTHAGTATPIDQGGYFLTAAHCIPGLQSSRVKATILAQRKPCSVEVVERWTDRDLALLFCPMNLLEHQVFRFRETKLRDGEWITIAGMPGYGASSARRWWQGRADMKSSDDTVLCVYMAPRKRLARVRRGTSGGPAVDGWGRLVGIFVRTLSKSKTISELFAPEGRKQLEEHMSKAYASMVFDTKFLYNRTEVSLVVSMLDQLRAAVARHKAS